MTETLIPALDPAPLPGPPWLFHLLWLVTFTIHLLFVNTVLGGTLLAALYPGARKGSRETRVLFVEVNSWAISLAVTFGIAPLLFVQVILGRFFYSATILVAWAWLGMLALLTVGYYLNYIAKFRLRAGRDAALPIRLAAVCFVGIAAIQVTVNLLHMQPGRWTSVATSAWKALADPTFVPRFLHFVLAAVAMAGALAAWVAVRRAGEGGGENSRAMASFGIRAALIATVLQLADGFWLLLALPEGVLRSLMRGSASTMMPLTLGILGGLGLLVLLAQMTDPLAQASRVRRVAEFLVATVILMIITRHQVRSFYLEAHRAGEQVVVATQWGVLALFLVVFVVCVGLTVYAVLRAINDRTAPGEQAA